MIMLHYHIYAITMSLRFQLSFSLDDKPVGGFRPVSKEDDDVLVNDPSGTIIIEHCCTLKFCLTIF